MREPAGEAGAPLARAAGHARDAAARALLAARLTPGGVTWAGFGVSLLAAAALLAGGGDPAGGWPLLAAAGITLAGVLDMLDGAMARAADKATRWGGVLDSTLDRVSDLALYGALGVHFAARGNLTLSTLAWLALAHGFLIAYLRSRAEVVTVHAAVGFWQRSERNTALAVAAALGHVPAALWILGTLPALTAWRRWRHVRALLRGEPDPEGRTWSPWLFPWRQPRGSAAHVLTCLLLIASIALAGPGVADRADLDWITRLMAADN